MDLAKPYASLSPSLDIELLVELARSTQPRSGRELARRIARSWGGVGPALDRLVEHGLVERDVVGSTHIYGLNRDHLLARVVEQLAGVRSAFIDRLRQLIGEWDVQPVHASIFGSMARGDGSTASDIDVFLVRPKRVDLDDETWRQQLDELSVRVRAWTGNPASLVEVGHDELTELRRQRRRVLKEIRADAIELAGKKAREVVGR